MNSIFSDWTVTLFCVSIGNELDAIVIQLATLKLCVACLPTSANLPGRCVDYMTADKVRRNVITLSDFHVEREKLANIPLQSRFYTRSDTRKDGITKGIFTAYKTSLSFYLIEILDGRYPENNICFLPFIRVSRRDCLNYTNPKECQNRLDRTVQFRQGSLDWYTCAFTRFPNEPVDGEHLLKGNRKKKQKSFYVTTTAISFSVFFFHVVVVVVALFHEHVARQLSDAQISYLRRKSKPSLLSPTTTRLH